jgi:hypothetical protein
MMTGSGDGSGRVFVVRETARACPVKKINQLVCQFVCWNIAILRRGRFSQRSREMIEDGEAADALYVAAVVIVAMASIALGTCVVFVDPTSTQVSGQCCLRLRKPHNNCLWTHGC